MDLWIFSESHILSHNHMNLVISKWICPKWNTQYFLQNWVPMSDIHIAFYFLTSQSLIYSKNSTKRRKEKWKVKISNLYLAITFTLFRDDHCWQIHCVYAKSLQSCPTLCSPMDRSPPGFSVHGILQARILEWFAIPFSKGSSRPRDRTQVSCIAGRFFTVWATREVLSDIGGL